MWALDVVVSGSIAGRINLEKFPKLFLGFVFWVASQSDLRSSGIYSTGNFIV